MQVSVQVYSGFSGFLPQSKDMQVSVGLLWFSGFLPQSKDMKVIVGFLWVLRFPPTV